MHLYLFIGIDVYCTKQMAASAQYKVVTLIHFFLVLKAS